jgi:hypothetical protein
MSLVVEPSTLQGKLTIGGNIYTQAAGENSCRRIFEATVVAKVFGVGGMIESRIISDMKQSYDKAAAFTNEWSKRPA